MRAHLRLVPALLVALCAPLGGCLEFDQSVTLHADGSGVQKVRMVVADATLTELQKASAAAQLGAAPNPLAVFDRELVDGELRAAGMELLAHRAEARLRMRHVEMEARFPNFAALQQGPLMGSTAEWVLAKGPQEGTAKLTLYLQGRQAWLDARAKAEQLAERPDPVAMDFFRRRIQQVAGLDLKLRLEVPGEVYVWTKNLQKVDERAVAVHVTAATVRTPEDLVRWLAPRFEVIFDARALTVKLP